LPKGSIVFTIDDSARRDTKKYSQIKARLAALTAEPHNEVFVYPDSSGVRLGPFRRLLRERVTAAIEFSLSTPRQRASVEHQLYDVPRGSSLARGRNVIRRPVLIAAAALATVIMALVGSSLPRRGSQSGLELPDMALIPATATIAAFEMSKYEVTFAEWDACVRSGGCDRYRPGDRGWGRGRRPVMGVSWDDAQTYVEWLSQRTGQSYRLPTEAEWMHAAFAGATTDFPWGDMAPACDQSARNGANFGACTDNRTRPAGSFQPNAFDLYDMQGNVREWVTDCAPFNCTARALRGGCWRDHSVKLKIFSSYSANPHVRDVRDNCNGFRVARTL
jgi:hypothetical protein